MAALVTRSSPRNIALLETGDPEWQARERALDAAGVALPFWHRASGASCAPGAESGATRLLAVSGAAGAAGAESSAPFALALREGASRALPGHRIWRVERLGGGGGGARDAALAFLVSRARSEPRVLRVEVSAVARGAARSSLEASLEAVGFRRNPAPRFYTDTLVIELDTDEDALLAGFHKQTRKDLRRFEREPFRVSALADPVFAERLDSLAAETMTRGGGPRDRENWATRLAVCAQEPERSRLVGLFREPGEGPEALLAFAWACHHGDHVEYCTTASTRLPGSRLPLSTPLAWDLIRWARERGAAWFDFGGVTTGSLGGADPLGGISDFKRSFSRQVETVGSEWIFEPRAMRASLARAVGALARWSGR